jgi:serine/threonine protein kinase
MIGTQVGSWVLLKLLGVGGMGQVYLAEHAVMKDLWAVKLLAPELTMHNAVVARFVDEARAAAKVRHRNLIRVFQIDRVPDGPWYMVLEYLEGSTLHAYMGACRGPLRNDDIVRLLSQVASALHALHKQGIIHRDLKPENIFLVVREDDDRFPVLLDLGVASLGNLATGAATQRGTVLGTPSYMAPEQLLGEVVHPQADVYALGAIVYEMSTGGWLPYQQDLESRDDYFNLAPAEIYRRQAGGPPIDPRRRNPGISDAWAKVIFRLLESNPAKRTSNTKAAAIELARAMPSDGIVDGLTIVREYAPDLLQTDNMLETLRSPRQAMITPTGKTTEARYAIGAKIGTGGMAEVFIGTQIGEQGFERKVAIKRVLAALSEQPGFAAMFIAEARIASRLTHSNIVSVIDFRSDPENRLFLVMEYVEGKDLKALLAGGPLPPSIIIYVIVEVLRGLGYAHTRIDDVTGTRGVVHRDISPHNVLVSLDGDVKINDFGLARVRDGGGWAGSSRIAGKPRYMSPEQVRGEPLDNRSDLWAVGVMLYEMLTCRPMFTGSIAEIMGQVQFQAFPRPSALRAGVPADLEAAAMQLLQRDVQARYASAELAIADLLRCVDAPLNGRDELAAHLAGRRRTPTPRRGIVDVAPIALPPYEERITNSASAVPSMVMAGVPNAVPNVVMAGIPSTAPNAVVAGVPSAPVAGMPSAPATGMPSAPVASVPSTLGSAASQSSPVVVPTVAKQRRSPLVWIAPVIILAAVVGGIVAGSHRSAAPTSVVVGARDASSDAQLAQPTASASPSGSVPVILDAGAHVAVVPAPADTARVATAPLAVDAALPPRIDAGADMASAPAKNVATASPDPRDSVAGNSALSPSVIETKQRSTNATPNPAPAPRVAGSAAAASPPQPPSAPHHAPSSTPSVTVPTGEPGELVVLAKPWAMIWINNKKEGSTPFRKTLPSGKYTVRLTNDDLDKTETRSVIVEPGKPTTIRRTW